MNQSLVEAEGNIVALTKRLDDALPVHAITATALEKANEEKKVLQLSAQSEVALLKAELEATAKARIGQQEVLTALRNDFPDFNMASPEEKIPPVELGDDVEASDAPDE
ncbi:hypothetical protein Adt_03260 [Abeliophyllum distichum]|uniref:Uncharacterized protein n=1 Tax=Abeliophyllum distichum TaxID=126358 RepID=A0ABD1VY87_9LAMI